MSKTFRRHERFPHKEHFRIKPTKRAQGWLDGELAKFREEESGSLSDLIDTASMASWVADHHDDNHR
jgi:hypothetical protein